MNVNKGIEIMLADDMIPMRRKMRIMLETLGFRNIFEAKDGADALNQIETALKVGAPVKFIISDLNMPNMNGLQLLENLRGRPEFAQLPFLLVTAESDRESIQKAVLAKVNGVILKPFTQSKLEETLKGIFQKL